MVHGNNKNHKRLFILKKIATEWGLIFVGGIVIYIIFQETFKDIFNVNSGRFQVVIFVVVIVIAYKSLNQYRTFMEFSERSDALLKMKLDPLAKVKLEQTVLFYAETIEIQQQKLTHLKTFSPIPVIIVSVEYFTKVVSLNLMSLVANITSFNFQLNQNEWLALLLFGVIIYYLSIYVSTWQRYRRSVSGYYEVKRHLLTYDFEN